MKTSQTLFDRYRRSIEHNLSNLSFHHLSDKAQACRVNTEQLLVLSDTCQGYIKYSFQSQLQSGECPEGTTSMNQSELHRSQIGTFQKNRSYNSSSKSSPCPSDTCQARKNCKNSRSSSPFLSDRCRSHTENNCSYQTLTGTGLHHKHYTL